MPSLVLQGLSTAVPASLRVMLSAAGGEPVTSPAAPASPSSRPPVGGSAVSGAVLRPMCPVDESSRLLSLMARAQRGDERARDQLLAALYPLVTKHLSFVLRAPHLRDEAVQEAMIEILRSLPRFHLMVSVRAWALKIATRTAHHYARRDRVHSAALTPEGQLPERSAGAPAYESRQQVSRLAHALEGLPADQREAFVLIKVLEFTGDEAAEVLGVPENTAFSRARLAREKLGKMLAEKEATA